jgi:hypothetical protein
VQTLQVDAMVLQQRLLRYAEEHVPQGLPKDVQFEAVELHFRERFVLTNEFQAIALAALLTSFPRHSAYMAVVWALETCSEEPPQTTREVIQAIDAFFKTFASAPPPPAPCPPPWSYR